MLIAATPIAGLATEEPPLPVLRFEQMLLRSPAPGRAFDEVFMHYSTRHSANDLLGRWQQQLAAEPSQAFQYHMALALLQQRLGDYEAAREQLILATAVDPDSFRPHFQTGRVEMAAGRYDEAIRAYTRATELDIPPPDVRDVFGELARAQQRIRDLDGAVATWQSLVEALPDDPFVLEEVGQALLDADRYDDARDAFEQMATASKGDPYRELLAQLKLAEVMEREQQTEAAIQLYGETLARTHPDSWLNREIAARIQSIFRRNNNIDGLIQFYEQRRTDFPADLRSARTLAALYRESKKAEQALTLLATLTEQAPNDFDLHFDYCLLLINEDQLDTAQPLLEALVQRQPRRWAFRETLGELYLRQARADDDEDYSLTLDTWAALIPEESANVSQLLQLADLYRLHEFEEQAVDAYAAALALEPDAYDLRERYAAYLFTLERDEDAWAVLRNNNTPLTAADHYLRLARIEHRHDLNDAALQSIRAGLAMEPDHFRLLELQWQIHAREAEWQACLDLYPALIANSPNQQTTDHVDRRQVLVLRSTGQLQQRFAELERQFRDGEPLSDGDMRLLSRLALNVDLPAAGQLIEEIIQQNPESLPIALIAVEYWNSVNDASQHVAALRRLIQLSPERSAEWLRAIVRAQQSAEQLDDARKTFAELAALYPDDPSTYVLESDIAYQAADPATGNRALRRAIRLSDDPEPLRNRLASRLQTQGNFAEALILREESFATAGSLTAQLSLVRPLAEAALQANVFDTYAAEFLTRDTGLRDTINFHLLRGELYFTARDLDRASAEWRRAHAIDSADPLLLQRMTEFAQIQGDTIARVDIARDLYRAAPTPDNALTLGKALIDNGDLEEGVQFLNATSGMILDDQIMLLAVLASAARSMAEDEIIAILKRESAHISDSSRHRDLVLAEALIFAGQDEEAEAILWDIFTTPDPETGNRLQDRSSRVTGGFLTAGNWHATFQRFDQLTQNRNPMGGTSRITTGPQSHPSATPRLLHFSRRNSLIYLARLAMNANKEDALVDQLDEYLRETGATRELALDLYASLGDRKKVAEIVVESFSEDDDIESLMTAHAVLLDQRSLNLWLHTANLEPDDPYAELAATLRRRIIDSKSPAGYEIMLMEARIKASEGDSQAARALLDEATAKLGRSSLAAHMHRSIIQLGLMTAFGSKDSRMALDYLSQTKDAPARLGMGPAAAALQFMVVFGDEPISEEDWEMLINLIADERLTGGSVVLNPQSQLHMFLNPPVATQGLNQHVTMQARQVYPQITPQVQQRLVASLQQRSKQSGIVDPVTLNLLFLLHVLDNNPELAVAVAGELLAAEPDDALRYNVANLLIENNRFEEAIAELNSIQVHSGDLFIATQIKLIEAAREAGNTDQAVRAAERLLRIPVPQHIQKFNFSQVLTDLGMADRIPRIQIARQQHHSHHVQQSHNIVNAMNTELNRANNAVPEVQERIARNVLQAVAFSDSNSRNPRERALKLLRDTATIDNYIAELQQQLDKKTDSVRLQIQLAEALHAKGDSSASLDIIRQLFERRPSDPFLSEMFTRILVETENIEELISYFDANPGPALLEQIHTTGIHVIHHGSSSRNSGRTGIIALYLDSDQADTLVQQTLESLRAVSSLSSATNRSWTHQAGRSVMALATTLNFSGLQQQAVDLWEAALSLIPDINPMQYTPVISGFIEAHQATGMPTEVLADRLFAITLPEPRVRQTHPSRFFSSRQNVHHFQSHNSFLSFSSRNGRIFNTAMASLDLIDDTELLLALLKRLHNSQADDGINPHGSANRKMLAFYLRSRLLDPTLADELDDIAAMLNESIPHQRGFRIGMHQQPVDPRALTILLNAMLNWPGIGDEIITRYTSGELAITSSQSQHDRNQTILNNNSQKITLAYRAALMGNLEQARMLLEQTEPYPKDSNIFHNLLSMIEVHRNHFETLILLDDPQGADEVVAVIVAAAGQRMQHNRPLQQLEELNSWMKPADESPQKMDANVWPVPSTGNSGELRLAWEIRSGSNLATRGRRGNRPSPVTAFGLPLINFDGIYQLRIDWLKDPDGEPLDSTALEAVDARGSTHLTPPFQAGYMKATLLLDGNPVDGEEPGPVPFSTSPNLLANPNLIPDLSGEPLKLSVPGWTNPTVLPVTLAGGPTPDGSHLLASPPLSLRRVAMRSNPIAINEGTNYLLSGWSEQLGHSHAGSSTRITLRFLDAQNNPLGEPVNLINSGNDLRWIRQQRILSTNKTKSAGATIPEGTKAVDIELGSGDYTRFAEIALQEL